MADTQAIKDKIDIVALVQEYVPLKKAGVNWKAPCPFHQEKSPSFMVNPEKQIWHCFGCGKGGDIFSFLQEMEGLEFIEALKLLAERAGVKIDTYQSEISGSQRNRIIEVNTKAAYFFHHILLEMPTSKPARDYLERRELKSETISDWQVGFIPEQWDLLTKYLLKKGCSIDDLIASGLTIKRDGADAKTGRGFYDRFRGRIMFPISDIHGNIVGFTGRVLVETEYSGGKYVNTPQTLVYDKSRALYGIHKAKLEIKNKDQVILVEGQMDVIACHQAGMKNVVAASGTALTHEQIKLLKRYTTNIAMAFDADSAGENAGKRGIEVALEEGMNIKVIQIPQDFAKDADECIKKDKTVWFKAVEEAKAVMEWYISTTLARYDISNPTQKQKAAEILVVEVARIPHAVERDHWLQQVAGVLRVDTSVLKEELGKVKKTAAPRIQTAPTISASATKPSPLISSRRGVLAQALWALLVKFPTLFSSVKLILKTEYFFLTSTARLYELAEKQYTVGNEFRPDEIVEEGELINILRLRADKDYPEMMSKQAEIEVVGLAKRLKEEWGKERRKELQVLIKEAEKEKNKVKIEILLTELQTIS
jgi:DNA primase